MTNLLNQIVNNEPIFWALVIVVVLVMFYAGAIVSGDNKGEK